jgi:hypothetical protein
MSKSINMGKWRWVMLLAVAVVALPSAASADFGIKPGSFEANILDSNGAVVPSPQAGAHPYAQQIKFAFNTKTANIPSSPDGYYPGSGTDPDPDGDAKTIVTNLPPGFIGNPQAAPRCEQRDFPPLAFGGYSRCATSAQVGVASVDIGVSTGQQFPVGIYKTPVYNLVPPKGVVARFGFVFVVPIVIDITVRTGSNYGITATVKNASETINIYATSLTLWGVPADPSHDAERFRSGQFFPGDANGQPLSAGLPLTPFLTNPAQCDAPLTTGLSVDSWQDPGKFLSYTSTPILYQGCDRLTLKSSLDVTSTSARAGEPTGLAVDLNVDQPQAPNALGAPPLRKAVVTLPEGVTVSPSSADGLGACTSDQIGLKSDAEPTCPDNSKVGSVQIDTPLLDEPLTGSVYLAKPNANPFNSLVALYIVAKASGVLVKLPGQIMLDQKTGRIVSVFDNTPQLPFSRLHVAFKGGPRAPLSQAITCGAKTTSATLTSWAGQVVDVRGTYTVGPGAGSPSCGPQGFAPQLTAGSLSSAAGASSPFSFRLTRSDADQQLSSVTTVLPEGLLANLKDVTLCQEPAAAAGTCGPESQIGQVTAGSGPGPSPFYINNGRAYLTAGYKGAPFGLSIVVRAIAGPFDLGDVIVRGALTIDPVTSKVTITTDPFPTILQGIPLQMRDVRLNVNRPGFMLNPTNCTAQTVDTTVVSTAGVKYSTSTPYRVTDCATLPFRPKLSLSLTGKGQTTDSKHPGVVAHLTQEINESRLGKVSVTLPLGLALDPDNAQALCKPEQALAKTCPATSIVGRAKAISVLHEPLQGAVYFVEGIRIDPKSRRKIKTLPKLFIPLKGEGVEVDLNASSEVDLLERLVTTFDHIPDAPIRSVDLTITGGKHGILVVSGTDVCKGTQNAQARMDGQNGKIADSKVLMVTPCSPSVISSSMTSKALTVKLGGLGAGKVTVSGSGLRKSSRKLAASSVATVVAKRTKGSVPTKIRVRFDPAGPAKATTRTLSLKKANAAKKSSVRR